MASHIGTSKVVLLHMQDAFRYDVCSDNVSTEIKQWQELGIGSYLSELNSQYDRRKVIGLSVVLTFLLTYTITFLKSSMGLRSKKNGREPPMAPYWIPFLGNLLPFLRDPFTYCAETT
jgi:ABC-type anion transport system duplicated permease subunit